MTHSFWRSSRLVAGIALTGLSLSLFSAPAKALESDRQQPISILADSAQFQPDKGQATYTGQVEIEQGSLKIRAHKITLYRQANGDIEKLVALGQSEPVHLQQQPTPEDAVVHAYGMRVLYQAANQQVELESAARLENGQDSFSGERIRYDLQSKRIQAWGQSKDSDNQSEDGRVKITLFPKGDSSAP